MIARLSIVLVKYISLEYIKKYLIFIIGFFVILFLARLLETLRVTSSQEIPFTAVLKISFNRSPYILQRIVPLVSLFSTASMISGFNRRNELAIIKASGVSIWQFIFPLVVISFILGVIFITIFNPIIATMFNVSQHYEKRYFTNFSNLVTITSSNIWLKEKSKVDNKFLRAKYVSNNGTVLDIVSVSIFDHNMKFITRIEAKSAHIIDQNTLECKNGYRFEEGILPIAFDKYLVNIHISPEGLQESFSAPGSISFWDLPQYIKLFKKAGFPAIRHQLHFVNILFLPFQMVIYSIIGVLSSLSLMRSGKFHFKTIIAIICGLIYFFTNEIIGEMSLNSLSSIYFTLAIPMIIVILTIIYFLLHIEES